MKPARCLTSEARSSRGRPARPQRGRKRVGRAELEAAGRPAPTKAPRGIDVSPKLAGPGPGPGPPPPSSAPLPGYAVAFRRASFLSAARPSRSQ